MSSKKIRDYERMMRKNGTKAGDNVDVEKKLNELRVKKRENESNEKDKKLCVKYRLVKFVERKKMTRKIRKVETKLKTGQLTTREFANLSDQKAKLEEDLAYIL